MIVLRANDGVVAAEAAWGPGGIVYLCWQEGAYALLGQMQGDTSPLLCCVKRWPAPLVIRLDTRCVLGAEPGRIVARGKAHAVQLGLRHFALTMENATRWRALPRRISSAPWAWWTAGLAACAALAGLPWSAPTLDLEAIILNTAVEWSRWGLP
ncbi:MAG: hypothetical protein HY543_03110 [Deltaproteobacteria bacterium]|nr:hypothetical protein [Deltaproteobacteria bacterium]